MGFRGRAQGLAPTITVGDKLSGNDEMRGVGCGFPRAGTGTRPYDYGRGTGTTTGGVLRCTDFDGPLY